VKKPEKLGWKPSAMEVENQLAKPKSGAIAAGRPEQTPIPKLS